jgi:hypothetical protein
VVGRSAVWWSVVVGLPRGWGQAFAHDGIVLEDEEEAPSSDFVCLEGSVYVGLLQVSLGLERMERQMLTLVFPLFPSVETRCWNSSSMSK